jgi:hypothetical protein
MSITQDTPRTYLKNSPEAKEMLRTRVLAGESYTAVAEALEVEYNIKVSKQAVGYYVTQMKLRPELEAKRVAKRTEQEAKWSQALRLYFKEGAGRGVAPSSVVLQDVSQEVGAPLEWTRTLLMSQGLYDPSSFRQRVDETLLIQRYVGEDLSLAEMHEKYYNDVVCISTLTQTVRQVMKAHGLKSRPKSTAKNPAKCAKWRKSMLKKLANSSITITT